MFPCFHEIAADIGAAGDEPPWLPMSVAYGIAQLERRLAAEARMDELDEPPRNADAA